MRRGDQGLTKSMSLGTQLRELRMTARKKKSIRRVAKEIGLSNAYLSQLERGVAENPSTHVLHKLAEYYEVPYETLMAAAGYVPRLVSKLSTAPSSLQVLLTSAKLSEDEEEEVKKFVRFLRSK